MHLLSYPVALILFAAISTATPPLGYIERPNDDKDPPNFHYNYEIGDVNGKGSQGKTETRSGELASGRYHVNDEKSSTDVKYYADEWGYHPLVKYHAENDHSFATAHFAHGEHVIKSLLNGSEVGQEVTLQPLKVNQHPVHRQPLHRRRPVQIIQPYTSVPSEIIPSYNGVGGGHDVTSAIPQTHSIDDRKFKNTASDDPPSVDILRDYDFQRTSVRPLAYQDSPTSSFEFHQNFNNYVTMPTARTKSNAPRVATYDQDLQAQHDYSLGETTSSIKDYRTFRPTPIHQSNHPSTSNLPVSINSQNENRAILQEASNNLFSTISDDILLVQNDGSFGRRLNPTANAANRDTSSGKEIQRSKQLASSTSRPYHEISTSQPIVRISDTTSNLVEHGASSYASYSIGTTTPRSTSVTYSTLIPDDTRHRIATPIPDFQEVHNSVGSEVSFDDHRARITDHRGNAVTSSYPDVFANIYPNGERIRDIGETVNSLSSENLQLLHYENQKMNDSLAVKSDRITTPGLSSYSNKLDHQLYVTLRQALDAELRALPNVQSSTPATLSTFSSKPIVVAELSDYKANKGYEYSTTFPCPNEEERESSTLRPDALSSTLSSASLNEDFQSVLVTPKLHNSHHHITTSSLILNPLQAGVSLVNAGETELIAVKNREPSPAPVNENTNDESQVAGMKDLSFERDGELDKILGSKTRSEFYDLINHAYGQSKFREGAIGKSIGASIGTGNTDVEVAKHGGDTGDQQIEIQKSVEIYQNAPVHEIHYPPEVITQVSGINRQHAPEMGEQRDNIGGLLHQRDEAKEAREMPNGYAELGDAGNAKQFHSSIREYNGKKGDERETEEVKHEHHGTQLSLGNIQDGSHDGTTVYLGNLVRHDNELADYSIERHNGNDGMSPGHEDSARIIKLIRDSIPEMKYTAPKSPQINVKVFPAIVQPDDNRQLIEKQQEAVVDQEQLRKVEDRTKERGKKVQSQLQRILSESGSVQRYFSGAEWMRLQAHEQHQEKQHQQYQHQQQQLQPEENRENNGNYRVQENTDDTRFGQIQQQQHQSQRLQEGELQPQQLPQSILVPWAQLYGTPSVKSVQESLRNTVEDVSPASHVVQQVHPLVPTNEGVVEKTIYVPQPYPVEVPRIIEKKVPYPVEKIVERKVPYPVEKIIEKKVAVPQPYPVHIQVPVDRIVEKQILQPYPVHIEKIIEKKIPYPVQRLVPQPYPVHIIQPYPIEKIIEKPVHIPVTIEKIVEKKVHVPQPYPVQIPIKVPYPVEITKYVGHSVQIPYGVRYGVSYQQIMKPQSSKGLYGGQASMSVPLYGLSLVSNQNRQPERPNVTQDFQGYNYEKPAVPFVSGRVESIDNDQHRFNNGWEQFNNGKSSLIDHHQRHQTFAKKSFANYGSKLPSSAYQLYTNLNRRHASYRQSNGPVNELPLGKDGYVGPVPSLKNNLQQTSRLRNTSDQQQQVMRSRNASDQQQHPADGSGASPSETSSSSSRRARQQDKSPQYQTGPGAFRQSKIEYGFKPPMVPSVQYDEKTATKVEN